MEFLFNSTNLTDVGCTMRLIRRQALAEIEPEFTIGGSAFGPEMMLLSLLHGLKRHPDSRQLPAARRRVLGHGRLSQGVLAGHVDDRAGAALPTAKLAEH